VRQRTCSGITAVRRSQFGHPEVAATHRDGDKPGKIFPSQFPRSAELRHSKTARKGRQLGGEEGQYQGQGQEQGQGQGQGQGRLEHPSSITYRPPSTFFPKRDERFSVDEREKMSLVSAYCLFFVEGGSGKAGRNLAYSSRAATAATSGIHPSHQVMASLISVNRIWAAAERRLRQTMDKTGRSMKEWRVAILLMMETSPSKPSHQVMESWRQDGATATRPAGP
jgi:hypothetical protein